MSAKLQLGPVSIDVRQYAIQGNAVLGIKDSGKTYTSTWFGERLMDAGVPIVAFDPIGVWRFLRVAGRGPGYPVVVAGGKNGDLPLSPKGAPEIVRAAMRDGVSLVIDLYSLELSKADWRAIVESCVRVLLYENGAHGLRHVFIEEAAEFAPQRVGPDQGRVYAEIEKLARMGGNAMLGYTLINQRAEEVNKAVLELCDTLFLFRQKGKNSLVSLQKWLDVAGAVGAKAIVPTLPTLAQGECWAWLSGSDTPARIPRMPEKRTLHPDRRAMHSGALPAQAKAVDVSTFVQHMAGTLEQIVKEAEANDPKRLKARIGELERAVAKGAGADPAKAKADRDAAYAAGVEAGRRQAHAEAWREAGDRLKAQGAQARAALDEIANAARGWQAKLLEGAADRARPPALEQGAGAAAPPVRRVEIPERRIEVAPRRRVEVARRPQRAAANGALSGVQQRILDALAELKALGVDRAPRVLVAFLAGYGHLNSKGFTNGLGSLSSGGLIAYPEGGKVELTDGGLAAANPAAAPLTSAELQARIVALLGGPEGRIIQAAIERYPGDASREEIAAAAGYGHLNSKGFSNAIGRLHSLGFIHYPRRGAVAATPLLFVEGG
jgi:uncharacterized protein